MVWKLCFAVFTLQLSCLLAADPISLNQLLTQMMQQNEDNKDGDSSSESSEETQSHSMEEALKHYLTEHHIDPNEDVMHALLQNYMDEQEGMINHYRMQQAGDLFTKSLLEEIKGQDDDGISEFAIDLVLRQIKAKAEPVDDSKRIMVMLFKYLMENPEAENKDKAMQVLFHVTARQTPHDQGVLRALVLHRLKNAHGEQKELLKQMFGTLMKSEFGGESMQPKDMFLLLIQHLGDRRHVDQDKKAVGMLMLQTLGERTDSQGKQILREYITKLILGSSEPSDIPDEHQWKYDLPGPCRVEDQNGEEVMSRECPEDLPCDLGPATYKFDGRDLDYYMCRFPEEYTEHLVFHACELVHPDGKVEARPGNCPRSTCELGPYSIALDTGDTVQVKYCSSYSNYSMHFGEWHPEILRACAIEDRRSGHRPLQRICPSEEYCTGDPFETEYEGSDLLLYMCQPKHHKGEDDLALRFLRTKLGLEREEEESSEEEEEQEEEAERDGEAEKPDGEEEEEHSEEFLNFIIMQLWEKMQSQEEDDDERDDMDENNPDVQTHKLLKYLVDKMARGNPLLKRFLDGAEMKFHLGIVSETDRLFMHAIIRKLLGQLYGMRDRDESREDLEGMEDLKRLLEQRRRNQGDVWRMLDDLVHAMHHKEIGDHLSELFDMLGGKHESESESESKESESESHEDDDLDEQEVIKMFLEKLQEQND